MIAHVLIALVRTYQMTLGRVLGGQCRFHPSCSAYAIEALRTHGALRGAGLAVWRVMRCGPWTGGGVDYPPALRASRAQVAVPDASRAQVAHVSVAPAPTRSAVRARG